MKNVTTSNDIVLQMYSIANSLSRVLKQVAEYLIQNPDEILHSTVTELAEKSNASEASIIRLCRKLGFKGYQDFKINFAKNFVQPLQNIHESLEESDDVHNIIQKVMDGHIAAIQDTKTNIDVKAFNEAIEAILQAKRIEFYGLGGSGAVAVDAQHKFFKLGIPCISYIDAHMQSMSASMLGPGDVVFGISHTGSTKDIVESLTIANKSGATTIAISSQLKSPVSKVAQINLLVVAKELMYRDEPLASRIAQLSVIDSLYVAVARKKQQVILSNLEKTRNALVNKRF